MSLKELIGLWITIISGIYVGVRFLWRSWGKAKWEHIKKNRAAVQELVDYNISGELKKIFSQLSKIEGEVTTNGGKTLKDLSFKILHNQSITKGTLDAMLYLDDVPTFKCDMDGNCFFVNAAWLQLLGFNNPEDAYGEGWLRTLAAPEKEKVRKEFQDAIKSETQYVSEVNKMNISNKSVIPVKMVTRIVRDEKEEPIEIVGQLKIK